jgi:hypothetical protein
MRYELLTTNQEGVKIYARIDDDGLCRVTCTEDNPDYQAWLNPPDTLIPTQPDEADLTEGTN